MHLPSGLQLSVEDGRLTLCLPEEPEAGVLYVDFCSAKFNFRRNQPLGSEAVVKAAGGCVSADSVHHLIDATAGLGEDAFLLAAAGWHVSMIEQSEVVHALLQDGLDRARRHAQDNRDSQLMAVLDRLKLSECADSAVCMSTLPRAEVVYLDPMFPERLKTARVKKNRYLLQQLHGEEAEGKSLLPIALRAAPKVVVKRPRLASFLAGMQPASSRVGKSSRFDIYVGQLPQVKMTGQATSVSGSAITGA
jgi:16S rRNA (guanine1516-N2)-methyltransferase